MSIRSAAEKQRSTDRRKQVATFAKKFASWKPAAEVLSKVRAVPTIFPDLDRATGVGGWPIERFALMTGPSNMGKTLCVHGLGLSFLKRDHFYLFIDAEMTTPIDWLEKLMGEHAANPTFRALRPRTYEQTVDAVREFLDGMGEAREKGELPEDTSALIVVDSIRKLVPKDLMAKMAKIDAESAKGSVDGMGGRAAQIKAAMNAAWLDELVPALHYAGAGMVAIAREEVVQTAFSTEIRIGGGRALQYDSSLTARVKREWIKDADDIVGERHVVELRKTKIADKDDKVEVASFCTSNGKRAPRGFWPARDAVELGVELGVIEKHGSKYKLGDRYLFASESAAINALDNDVPIRDAVVAACREKFA